MQTPGAHQTDSDTTPGRITSPLPTIWGTPLGPFGTNCYVISVPERTPCWIIDASFEPRPLIEHVRAAQLEPEALILTHAHIDHIAGLDEIRRAFPGLPVLIHQAEAAWLADPVLNLSEPFGEPFTTKPAERLLQGDETLTLVGSTWNILHTPGHSPGGITLWCPSARFAVVGDTLFNGSIGRHDFPTSDPKALTHSIRHVLYALPEDTRVYCGHGPSTSIAQERRSNPFVRP